MFSFFGRIIAFFLALFFLGSVSSLDPNPLYVTCPSDQVSREGMLPLEAEGNDPAFFAEEALAPEYTTEGRMTELGFTHLVGMWNIVTALPCDRGHEATVEFKAFRIIEREPHSATERVVQELTFDSEDTDTTRPTFDYTTYHRTPWFTGGMPTMQPVAATLMDDTYRLNARFLPKAILHGWTEPRIEAASGKEYVAEVLVRVAGDARLQLGMDYWKGEKSEYNGWSEGCKTSNNCQAWLSDWIGDTGGEFILWRAPIRVK